MPERDTFGLTPETTIRDSLYDLVPLSAEAAAILSAPPFLRLDGVQQLGFVSRVWPGARHTRFEHSLGVMHLAREALVRLIHDGAPVSDRGARTAIAAALLHDIGHYPFSHAIEELGPPISPHEAVARHLILDDPLDAILRAQWEVDPIDVANLIDPPGPPRSIEERLLRSLLSGALDVDKLDYLPRDARACAVPYGGVDSTRLLDALTVIERTDGPAIAIRHKGISPLHSLINARQEMFDNVYWHHTNRACMAMLLRAVQDAIRAGLDPAELPRHTDSSLLERLSQEDMPETTRRLVAGLRERRIHKRAVEISYRAPDLFAFLGHLFFDPERRRALEQSMVARLRELTGHQIREADILIDIPKPERWRTQVWVQFDRPPVGFQPVMTWQDFTGIDDSSLRIYEEHRRLIRIVASEPIQQLVNEHWEQITLPLLAQA
ncbi:MAG: HD domain-containing protein [Chloroflexota bacterium]